MVNWIDRAIEEGNRVLTVHVMSIPLKVVLTESELLEYQLLDDSWSLGLCLCCSIQDVYTREDLCLDCRSGNLNEKG